MNKPSDTHRLRVPAMVPWPGRHADSLDSHPESKRHPKATRLGDVLFTIGTPQEPSSGWTCGTDVVWLVYEINGQAVIPDELGRLPCVCRHQIVAGD